MYYIYIIRCHDNSLYTGITIDLNKRMKAHYFKTKECAKYTRVRDVISLDAVWSTANRSLASKLEYQIKKLTKKEKEKLIQDPLTIDTTIYQYLSGITLQSCIMEETSDENKHC